MPSLEQVGTIKEREVFWESFGLIRVVLSPHLVRLRTEKCSLVHGLFCNNEGTREATIEQVSDR